MTSDLSMRIDDIVEDLECDVISGDEAHELLVSLMEAERARIREWAKEQKKDKTQMETIDWSEDDINSYNQALKDLLAFLDGEKDKENND